MQPSDWAYAHFSFSTACYEMPLEGREPDIWGVKFMHAVKFMHIFVDSGVERNRFKLKIEKLRKSFLQNSFLWTAQLIALLDL